MEISKAATNMYWKRWMKEYLPLLALQNKWTKHCKNMKIGDIAVIEEDYIERLKWPLA